MPRQHNSQETRELIINSAIDVFIKKGYSKATLEEIVQHIGLTRGAFYWNFSSKREILDEILKRYEQFYLNIYASYLHCDSAYATLKDFLTINLERKNVPNPYLIIVRYKVEASKEMEDISERQLKMDNQFLSIIEKEIERGQSQNVFRKDMPASTLARVIYTYLLGFDTYNLVHFSVTEGHFWSNDQISQYVDFLMSSLT